MIQAVIYATSGLITLGQKLAFLWGLGVVLWGAFGDLLRNDLVVLIILNRRSMRSGHWHRKQPDPNPGRYRVSDQWRFPPLTAA